MSKLFNPITLGSLTLANRIIIAPMCQYSAIDGNAGHWHTIHYGNLALSNAGLLIIEATAVEPAGRISPQDVGLWNDENERALATVVQAVKEHSNMPIAIQLAHAGRKASTHVPWQGGQAIAPDQEQGWQTVAPSAIPFSSEDPTPHELTLAQIEHIVQSFAESAKRAARIGLDAVEIHAAHGYLLHQFLSPLSNKRTDLYGGSLENRMRLVLEVFSAVKAALPAGKTIGVRISATDWVADGWDLMQSIELAKKLDALGCHFIHVSSGGLSSQQHIAIGPNYQVPFAEKIKLAVSMPVIAVGLITEPEQAEAIIGTGQADMVAIARAILFDPRWPWRAAAKLGATITPANQYLRAAPHDLKSLFKQK
jgi:2,4-dienoyl-CoA reductase-like NADH-dependent reductase (Old Yellow Enzyme family)